MGNIWRWTNVIEIHLNGNTLGFYTYITEAPLKLKLLCKVTI